MGAVVSTACAQQEPAAKAALAKVVSIIKNSTVKIVFTTSISQASGKVQHMSGTLVASGNKYKLSVNGSDVYFDGKTQWVYVPENKEVTISNISTREQKKMNPLAVLSQYSGRDTKIMFSREGYSAPGQSLIAIFPVGGSANEFKILVKLDKRSNTPQSLQLFSRDGTKTTVLIKSFQKLATSNKAFVFDVKAYPGININDLR